MFVEKAYAKINLYLDVVGVRSDGFHDIKSVMHSVDLCDVLEISIEPSFSNIINITCDSEGVPCDKSNIIYRAAEAYLNRYGIFAKINILLRKNIPVCAGLGGGSSDGAAILRALNKHFGKASIDELLEIAAGVGSDVPFCLYGGAALCEGRGELLTAITPLSGGNVVIAIGKERVSTPRAYSAIDIKYPNLGKRAENNNCVLENLLSSMQVGLSLKNLYNIFEEVVALPEVAAIKREMMLSGANCTLMSGSGPSVFGVYDDEDLARYAVEKLSSLGYQAFYTNFVDKS